MNGKTHLLCGIAIGADIGFMLIPGLDCFTFAAGTALGSILPDIDTPDSLIGHALPMISRPINKIFGHRTITHAPITVAALFLLNTILHTILPYPSGLNGFTMGLIFGILLHLLQDLLTYKGIPLLYPFVRKPDKYGRFTSLSRRKSDDIINTFITMLIIGLVFAVVNFHATPLSIVATITGLFTA